MLPLTGSLFHLNIFTPHDGQMEAFMATQLDGLPRIGNIPGWTGSRLLRAEDDRNAVLIAGFESAAAHQAFMASEAFTAHRDRLKPLIAATAPAYYRLAYGRDPGAK
jgi:quinol monooxygenase YgiN